MGNKNIVIDGGVGFNTGFDKDRDHAPIDSEIYALLDSIGASYIIQAGIVTVVDKYGDTWNFSEPRQLKVCR